MPRMRLGRYAEFQRRQRAALRASQHPHQRVPADERAAAAAPEAEAAEATPAAGSDRDPGGTNVGGEPTAYGPGAEAHGAHARSGATTASPYGVAGRPLNRYSPLYIGFVGAVGVLLAIGLARMLAKLSTTITILVVAFFLALALDPIVGWLLKRGVRRSLAVSAVFAGVVLVFALLGLLVVPTVIPQGAALLENAPEYVDRALNSSLVKRLDQDYGIVDRLQSEINARLTDAGFVSQIFGGVLGAGRALANGVFQSFTVLILTLYFLASLPTVKGAVYAMVPASRRPRVISLAEEIMRRTGSYAIGQVAVATINALASYVMMRLVGIQYAAVLAVMVGFLGLIPMVGATIGAVLVCGVAFFSEPRAALIAATYYLIYQQLENYVVAPRIMARTVAVPGAVTVVAALAGGTLLGVLGALLAIPVAAGLLLLYEEVLLPRQRHA